jgi:hypothetical protein
MTSVRWLLADHPLPSQALGAVCWHQQRFFLKDRGGTIFCKVSRKKATHLEKKPEQNQNGGEQRDD